jgi:hypothetical protein
MPLFLQLDQVLHDLLDRHRRVYTGDLVDIDLLLRAEGGVDPVEVCSEVIHAAVTRSREHGMGREEVQFQSDARDTRYTRHTYAHKEEKYSPSVNPTEDLTPLRTPFHTQDDLIHIIRVFVEEPSEELEVGSF